MQQGTFLFHEKKEYEIFKFENKYKRQERLEIYHQNAILTLIYQPLHQNHGSKNWFGRLLSSVLKTDTSAILEIRALY